MDFFELGKLTFERPDTDTFCALKLALDAAHRGGSMPTVLNAANEAAVRLFLRSKIRFLDIPDIIEEAMSDSYYEEDPDVDGILAAQARTLEFVNRNWRD